MNLALLASSVRNRLLEVREHLEISIITVLMAAHHNATEAARATWQHRRRTIRNLEQIVDILERLMNAIDGGQVSPSSNISRRKYDPYSWNHALRFIWSA